MRKIYVKNKSFEEELSRLRMEIEPKKLWFENKDKIRAVEEIIEDVYRKGDVSICEYTERFDGVRLNPKELRVSKKELEYAYNEISRNLIETMERAIENVKRYQEHIKVFQQESLRPVEGVELRTRYTPIERVGICVPGGSVPLPSTVIMSAVPAIVAGVSEIVIVSPPRYKGTIHPAILACCHLLNISEVYRIGGAQGVAGIGLGTETIRKVDKIVGPGNIYVQIAKKLLFGIVDIDSFAGPSEIVVLADDSADPRVVSADLISQAEHNPGSGILVTVSEELANEVERIIPELLSELGERGREAKECLDRWGAVIIAEDINDAVSVVNRLAPEHLSVQVKNYKEVAEKCIAGAIFLGPYTSESVGDYIAGPSHVLPTGGTARFFGPLNAMDFIRQSSVIEYDMEALNQVASDIKVFTDMESLPGHFLSIKIRTKK